MHRPWHLGVVQLTAVIVTPICDRQKVPDRRLVDKIAQGVAGNGEEANRGKVNASHASSETISESSSPDTLPQPPSLLQCPHCPFTFGRGKPWRSPNPRTASGFVLVAESLWHSPCVPGLEEGREGKK